MSAIPSSSFTFAPCGGREGGYPERMLAELVVTIFRVSVGSTARSGPSVCSSWIHRLRRRRSLPVRVLLLFCVLPLLNLEAADTDRQIASRSTDTADNRNEIERALAQVPPTQYDALRWLVQHMPAGDRAAMDAEFLLEHVDHAWNAWRNTPWADSVPREIFLDAILPYASVSETRESLRRHLDAWGLEGILQASFAHTPLSREEADQARTLLWEAHAAQKREERAGHFTEQVIDHDGHTMPFWYTTYGERPPGGRSLYISMHGGGGTAAAVNDRQWENHKRLYQPEEGVYLAPRAPTNTWNLWHQAHIDPLFDRLIADLILFEDVNPDRVYLMGYSAGGDGVYQLAARMSDRFAAAAMMAGHPNDAPIQGLRNLPFTLHMGSEDHAYNRNRVAREWKQQLGELRENDPEGYPHRVEIHEGKGHWMEGEDAAALPWMAGHTRSLRPDRVVWIQHAVAHSRYYWLAVGRPVTGTKTVVERRGQTIEIHAWDDQDSLSLRLDDTMLDLDAPVTVKQGERKLFRGKPARTIATLVKTMRERNDPQAVFPAEITVLPVP